MGTKYGLFRFADGIDKLLMFLGALGSIGEGLAAPMTMYMLSGAIDAFGTADQSIANEVVGKYGLRLLYVAFGVGFSCFLEGLCWTRTAERQTSRIRMEYLKSVLRQEVGYFDNQDASSTTFQVVSNISADTQFRGSVICTHIWRYCCFPTLPVNSIGFSSFRPWIIIPGVGLGKLMMDMGIKSKDAYGVAGSIIEQAINIRKVYSYVGEQKIVEKFSRALEESMNLGIKQGLMKGLMIGSMGMIFATWAFQSWVGGLLVTEKGESGGHVFIAGISIVLGGL
ncbi:UNVERIFIED_CONTAM: ABC transporter B family member 15 [Sesamum angustifolium]|uniref:ABC transporter B family member 15 n=1 Tax=Sesamum angustifolium TaxID=2727405 RepID=A0AAW2M7D3_9LAMI